MQYHPKICDFRSDLFITWGPNYWAKSVNMIDHVLHHTWLNHPVLFFQPNILKPLDLSCSLGLNMFAPTRTLLHTYNRHGRRHHHHHHHHHHNHHLYLHEGSNFATPSEQYVDWCNNINYISMRDQILPPPMSNMLIGVITSTISPWGIKIRHPLWAICWLG